MLEFARISFRPALVVIAAGVLPLVGVVALSAYGLSLENSLRALSLVEAAALLFVLGSILAALSLLPSHAISLAAGWLYGVVPGTLLALMTISAASVLGFVLARVLCGEAFTRYVDLSPRWSKLKSILFSRDTLLSSYTIALIRLSPAAPFAATNAIFASIRVALAPFLFGTAVGMLPRIAVVASLGAGMSEIDWSAKYSPILLVLGLFATALALWVVSKAAVRAFRSLSTEESVERVENAADGRARYPDLVEHK